MRSLLLAALLFLLLAVAHAQTPIDLVRSIKASVLEPGLFLTFLVMSASDPKSLRV